MLGYRRQCANILADIYIIASFTYMELSHLVGQFGRVVHVGNEVIAGFAHNVCLTHGSTGQRLYEAKVVPHLTFDFSRVAHQDIVIFQLVSRHGSGSVK